MDAGLRNSVSSNKTQSRFPLQEEYLQRKNSSENLDRFIPNRSAMDFDYAHYMVTKGKENPATSSPSREAYRKQLAEALNMNRTRILAFKNKPPTPVKGIPNEFSSAAYQAKPTKPKRHISQSPDGCTVASAAGDETLRFWNVFGTPEVAKQAPKSNPEPFAHINLNITTLGLVWHLISSQDPDTDDDMALQVSCLKMEETSK